MGLRGPAPTPTKILEDRGSWKAKTRPNEPRLPVVRPEMPVGLSATEKKFWHRVCDDLVAIGCAAKVDGAQLERYVRYFLRWRRVEKSIAREGMLDEDGAEHELLAESHRLNAALQKIEAQFGLTPSARTRLQCAADTETTDPMEAFFKPKGN